MKQVKGLILKAFLVLALSTVVQASDIGNPGIRSVAPGDAGSPTTTTTTLPEVSSAGTSAIAGVTTDLSDPLIRELFLALLALF